MSQSRQGITCSPETRRKMRLAALGRKHSAETCAKMSVAYKLRWQDPEYRDRTIRATLKGSHNRPTVAERGMQSILDGNFPGEWKYVGNGEVIIGGKNPDFINVNGRKAVVEVFGDYWHSEEVIGIPTEQHVAERVAHFAKFGFACLIFWERELKDADMIAAKIREDTTTAKEMLC